MSLAPALYNFVQVNDLNPFTLWDLLEKCFHNQSTDLEMNIQLFYSACKGADEKVIDFISCLKILCCHIMTGDNKVGDNVFI